jgi:hypothetical protein
VCHTVRTYYRKVRISNESHLNIVALRVELPASSGNLRIKVAVQARRIDREPVVIILALIWAIERIAVPQVQI